MNGLTAAGHLKHSVPKAKLVFLTMNEDPELVGEAFRAGASAFLLKQSAAFELTDAVEKVLKGGSYVTPRAAKGQTNIFLRGPQAREKAAELTLRQREIIQLMAEGRSSHLRIRKQSFWRSRSCNDRPVQRHLAGQRVSGSNQTTASASSVVLVPHMR
jgi:FixJ family two-component response regulator